jgi:hypothetical protein
MGQYKNRWCSHVLEMAITNVLEIFELTKAALMQRNDDQRNYIFKV